MTVREWCENLHASVRRESDPAPVHDAFCFCPRLRAFADSIRDEDAGIATEYARHQLEEARKNVSAETVPVCNAIAAAIKARKT